MKGWSGQKGSRSLRFFISMFVAFIRHHSEHLQARAADALATAAPALLEAPAPSMEPLASPTANNDMEEASRERLRAEAAENELAGVQLELNLLVQV